MITNADNQQCSIYNAIKNYLGEVVGKYEPKLEKNLSVEKTDKWQFIELAGKVFRTAVYSVFRDLKENIIMLREKIRNFTKWEFCTQKVSYLKWKINWVGITVGHGEKDQAAWKEYSRYHPNWSTDRKKWNTRKRWRVLVNCDIILNNLK